MHSIERVSLTDCITKKIKVVIMSIKSSFAKEILETRQAISECRAINHTII